MACCVGNLCVPRKTACSRKWASPRSCSSSSADPAWTCTTRNGSYVNFIDWCRSIRSKRSTGCRQYAGAPHHPQIRREPHCTVVSVLKCDPASLRFFAVSLLIADAHIPTPQPISSYPLVP